jgi:hypothetical protein
MLWVSISHDVVTDHQSVNWLDGQGVWIDHLQACSGNKNGLQFSCHIALHCIAATSNGKFQQWQQQQLAYVMCEGAGAA